MLPDGRYVGLTDETYGFGFVTYTADAHWDYCRKCDGLTAAQCSVATVEKCEGINDVCQTTIRRKDPLSEPLWFSSCQSKEACQ